MKNKQNHPILLNEITTYCLLPSLHEYRKYKKTWVLKNPKSVLRQKYFLYTNTNILKHDQFRRPKLVFNGVYR